MKHPCTETLSVDPAEPPFFSRRKTKRTQSAAGPIHGHPRLRNEPNRSRPGPVGSITKRTQFPSRPAQRARQQEPHRPRALPGLDYETNPISPSSGLALCSTRARASATPGPIAQLLANYETNPIPAPDARRLGLRNEPNSLDVSECQTSTSQMAHEAHATSFGKPKTPAARGLP